MNTKILPLVLILALSSSCSEADNETNEEGEFTSEKVTVSSSGVESLAKGHIESSLGIPANEKYSYEIYKADLDGDKNEDAIITVNRKEFALSKAAANNSLKKFELMGFVGNSNYIFYFDGGLNKISPAIPIPSSCIVPLRIQFEHVQSEIYKDIIISYRMMDASYRDYYTVINHTPKMVFQWKNYSGINQTNKEAYTFRTEKGSYSEVKDILIYKASFVQEEMTKDIYSYEPKLVESNELAYRFFYNPKDLKYYTKK